METENDQNKDESVTSLTNKELDDEDADQERSEDTKTESVEESESTRKRSIDEVDDTEEQDDTTVKKSKVENENNEEENEEKEESSEKEETNNKDEEQVETVPSDDAITNGDSQESLESKDSSQNSGGESMVEDKLVVNGVSDSASRKDDDDDNQSVVPSEDSEKENRQTDLDLPMDLSTKSGGSSTGNGPDVIMLSDSEEELMAGMMNGDVKELSMDELKKRKKLIKQLQTELRNEEAKLVLLKKLRQSQISHQLQDHNSVSNRQQSPRQQPPPLVRGSQIQGQARPAHAHNQPPQLMRGSQGVNSRGHQGPPPLVNMGNQRGGENRHSGQQSQQQNQRMGGYQGGMMPGQSMPNSMGGYRSGGMSVPQNQQSMQQVDNQTPAQRQAAAKMALRKQLEKTLLQIPPPKPPPPEMNFVPSLATPDFIYLLGLEEAVNYIIDADLISKGQKNPDEKMVCTPFTCVQCRTDFTPVWKREKPGSKNVICEHCVTTNQKKALKQEHTNRLKSAFVKALQQEQEIERMQSQATSSNTPPVAVTTSAPPAQSMPSSPMNASSAPFTSPSEAMRQHQNFIQAHQVAAQTALRMGQPLGMTPFRGGFPYQIPFGAKASDVQLHRQYLLDMIPNRAPMSWKQ